MTAARDGDLDLAPVRDLVVVTHAYALKLELLCDNLGAEGDSESDLWALQALCCQFGKDLIHEWDCISEKRRRRADTAGAPS